VAALAFAAFVAGQFRSSGGGTGRVRGDPPRIAVLYFENRTRDSTLRLFADGLTEDLIHELGGINAFRVISRNGVRLYRDRQVPFDSMVARLGVTTVIDGSLRRVGDTLHVAVDLIDAATGTNVDSVTVKRPLADFGTLQRELAQQVATTLRRRMGREVHLRDDTPGTVNPPARELVLKARGLRDDAGALMAQSHPEDIAAALGTLERADSLLRLAGQSDPRWLRPLLDRGWTAQQRASALTGRNRVAVLERGLSLAEEAVRRAPKNAEALQLRGTLRWDLVTLVEEASPDSTRLAKAEKDLRAALDRDSTLARAWATLSYLLWLKGSFAEAAITAQRALREDAYLVDAREIYLQLFFGALFMSEFGQAGEWCRRGRVYAPGDWRFVECELTLLRHDLRARPMPESAWALVGILDRLLPVDKAAAAGLLYHTIYRRIVAATISARAGNPDTARAELARAHRATANDSSLRLDLAYDEAFLRLVMGERDRAEQLLASLVSARPVLGPLLARDPLFSELRAVGRQ
jgi:TolB-like protein/tetratricopeptide (TPR) repeat protein